MDYFTYFLTFDTQFTVNGDARTLIGSVIPVNSDLSERTLNGLKPILDQERDRSCQETMMDTPQDTAPAVSEGGSVINNTTSHRTSWSTLKSLSPLVTLIPPGIEETEEVTSLLEKGNAEMKNSDVKLNCEHKNSTLCLDNVLALLERARLFCVEHLARDERAHNLLCVRVSYQPCKINFTRHISNRVSSDKSHSVFAIAGGAGLDSFPNLDSKLPVLLQTDMHSWAGK